VGFSLKSYTIKKEIRKGRQKLLHKKIKARKA